ncbi:MAG: sensor histidine kinase [Halorientalis sp.]
MTVVTGYNEVFADELDGEYERMARTVLAKADDLIETSEKARTVEKLIEANQQPAHVELTYLVTNVCADCRNRFPDVTFVVDCPDHCTVTTVPSLELAITNIIENAAQHNDTADPTVTVSVVPEDGATRLVVSDNGPGLPQQELAVLEQGEETPLEHASGLGLWIVDWVVRKSNASITYDVEDGTTVELLISA